MRGVRGGREREDVVARRRWIWGRGEERRGEWGSARGCMKSREMDAVDGLAWLLD